jgi:hypothetical protein
MERLSSYAPISSSSRRRLVRRLVGLPFSDVERYLVLENLAHTHGNRTVSARLLGVSVRTLRNKITEYSAAGHDIPRHESRDEILNQIAVRGTIYESKTSDHFSRKNVPPTTDMTGAASTPIKCPKSESGSDCQIDIEKQDRNQFWFNSLVQAGRRSPPAARRSRWAWSIIPLRPSRLPCVWSRYRRRR